MGACGLDLDPDAFELTCFIGCQGGHSGRWSGPRHGWDRICGAEVEEVDERSGECAAEMGAMTDGQPAAAALRDQTPEVETDKGEHPGERRHRHDAEEENAVARKMEGVGEQQTADRALRTEGEDIVSPQQE